MTMATLIQALLMEGHGAYIWSAWLITLLLLSLMLWWPYSLHRSALKALKERNKPDAS